MALWHFPNIADVDYGCLPMSSLSCCCTASSSSWASVALSVASWFGVSGATAGELTPTRSVQILSCFFFLALLIRLSSLNNFKELPMTASQKTRTRNLRVILGLQRTLLCKFKSLVKQLFKGQSVQFLYVVNSCVLSVCYVLLIFLVSLYFLVFYFLQNSF